MATTRVGGLSVILSAVTGPFDTAIRKSAGGVKSFGTTVAGTTAKVAKYGAALGAVAAGGLAVFVSKTLDSIDKTAKLSGELGISTEALSAYNLQADLTGTSMQDVAASIEKMQRNLGDAFVGVGAAKQGFAQLGLTLEDIQGLSPERQFETIADALSRVEDTNTRASAGAAIFGGKYKKIATLVDQGSEGFKKAREETERLGTSLSSIDAAQIEQANDAMRLVGEQFQGFIQQITIKLAPAITAVANMIANTAGTANDFGGVMDNVIGFGIKGVEFLVDAWSGLKIAFNLGRIALVTVGIAGNKAINGLVKAFQFVTTIGKATWETISIGAARFGRFLGSIFDSIKIGFATFVQFAGAQVRDLLNGASTVARQLKATQGIADDLQIAAGQIGAATGDAVWRVKKGIRESNKELSDLDARAAKVKKTFAELGAGTSDEVSGSAGAIERIAILERDKQAAITSIATEAEAIRGESSLAANLKFEIQKANDAAAVTARANEEKLVATQDAEEVRQNALLSQQETFNAQQHANEQSAMQKNIMLWKSGLKGRLQLTGSILGQLGTLMQSKSRKAFEVGKAAAISEAVINTSLAANKAYQAMVGIPIVGPALAAGAAASAVAAGVVQVQNIKSTSFGGGSVASSGGGGGGGAAAGAIAPDAVASSGVVAPPLEVVIDSDSEAVLTPRGLVDILNQAQEDGALISSVRLA